MSTTRLPPAPEPFAYPTGTIPHACVCGSWPGGECLRCTAVNFYTADQMHAYGLAVWKAAMEQASEACERLADSARRSNPSYCPDGDEYAAVVQHLPLPELAGSPQERRE